jgi:hypothetical protein
MSPDGKRLFGTFSSKTPRFFTASRSFESDEPTNTNPVRGDLLIENARLHPHFFVFGTRAVTTILHIIPSSRACRKRKELRGRRYYKQATHYVGF